ncbi:MAG: metal-dependent transcriptional regulator [Candidatus Hydrogenedentes bacterium]|nr:metal-dependent transcriptional regulator [Candidatus Hydrogenedentota bacterium]
MKKETITSHKKPNITHSRIHYLWAINELSKTGDGVKAINVAKLLGVTRSAVSIALNNLKKQKLVVEKYPGHFLQLTHSGKKQLEKIDSNYLLLVDFLNNYLNLEKDIAEKQACLIEHLLLDEVAVKLSQLLAKNHHP